MKLSKPVKILLGVVTILPPLYLLFFMGFMMFTFATTFSDPSHWKEMFDLFHVIFILHFSAILLSFALITFYMLYLFKTERVPQDKKALWAAVLFLGSFIAMPIFWYLYVWREA